MGGSSCWLISRSIASLCVQFSRKSAGTAQVNSILLEKGHSWAEHTLQSRRN